MESMKISFPEPLKQFVDGEVAQGRYSGASEYVCELIRADEKRKAEERLESKLLEGLNSAETADRGRLDRDPRRGPRAGEGPQQETPLMRKVCHRQAIVSTTPPSTRNAAPVVADDNGEAM